MPKTATAESSATSSILVLGTLICFVLASTPSMAVPSDAGDANIPTTAEVVVIGAGASGLRVADRLVSKFGVKDVVVLEARHRIGGRLLSIEPAHTASSSGGVTRRLDLGATWYWPSEQAMVDFLESETTKEVASKPPTVFKQHYEGDAMAHYFDHSSSIGAQQRSRMDGNPLDMPNTGRVAEGMMSICDILHSRLPSGIVQLGSVVTSIDAHAEGNRYHIQYTHMPESTSPDKVAGVQRQITGDHVVIALPPALAVRNIEFSPALPADLQNAAEHTPVWMGSIVKAVAEYRFPFWRKMKLSGSASSRVGPLHEVHDMSSDGWTKEAMAAAEAELAEEKKQKRNQGKRSSVPSEEDFDRGHSEVLPPILSSAGSDRPFAALFGFGQPRSPLEVITEEEVVAQLKFIFGGVDGYHDPIRVTIQDWRQEEFTSFPKAEQLHHRQLFGHSIFYDRSKDERRAWRETYWTSTETAVDGGGHIEGAFQAAERTARAIAASRASPHAM